MWRRLEWNNMNENGWGSTEENEKICVKRINQRVEVNTNLRTLLVFRCPEKNINVQPAKTHYRIKSEPCVELLKEVEQRSSEIFPSDNRYKICLIRRGHGLTSTTQLPSNGYNWYSDETKKVEPIGAGLHSCRKVRVKLSPWTGTQLLCRMKCQTLAAA